MTHETLSIYNSEGGSLGQSEVSITGDWPIRGQCWCEGDSDSLPSFHELVPATTLWRIEISSQRPIIHPATSWWCRCQCPNIQCKVKMYCFKLLWVHKNTILDFCLVQKFQELPPALCLAWLSMLPSIDHTANTVITYSKMISGDMQRESLRRTDDTRVIDELGTPSHFLLATLEPLIGRQRVVRDYAWLSAWAGIIMHAKCRTQSWQ